MLFLKLVDHIMTAISITCATNYSKKYGNHSFCVLSPRRRVGCCRRLAAFPFSNHTPLSEQLLRLVLGFHILGGSVGPSCGVDANTTCPARHSCVPSLFWHLHQRFCPNGPNVTSFTFQPSSAGTMNLRDRTDRPLSNCRLMWLLTLLSHAARGHHAFTVFTVNRGRYPIPAPITIIVLISARP